MAEMTARAEENDRASAAVEVAVEEKKMAEEARVQLQKELVAITRGRDELKSELKSELKKSLVARQSFEAEVEKVRKSEALVASAKVIGRKRLGRSFASRGLRKGSRPQAARSVVRLSWPPQRFSAARFSAASGSVGRFAPSY